MKLVLLKRNAPGSLKTNLGAVLVTAGGFTLTCCEFDSRRVQL